MKFVPGTGSPPMPTHVDTPMPFCLSSYSAWYVSVPERQTMPTLGPSAVGCGAISPAVMPMLHLPGLMMPGQFGPSSRVFGKSRTRVL